MRMNLVKLFTISPFKVFIDNVFLLEYDVFAPPVLDHAQELQRRNDVVGLDP